MTGQSLLYRVFRRDIGRKLTALFLAVLVYSAVDQQISDIGSVYVRIEYRQVFDAEVSSADGDWVLIVVQRHNDNKPLIVPMEERKPGFRLELSGSKTAIERLRASPPTLRYFPAETGLVQVRLNDLDGIEDLRSSLATDGVDFETPLTLTFAEVMEETVTLGRDQIEIMGTPLTGWELPREGEAGGIVFNPASVRLSGPKYLIEEILAGVKPVYSLSVDGKSGIQEMEARLHGLVAEELSQMGAVLLPDVTIRFVDSMVPLPQDVGRFERTVNLVVDDLALDAADRARLDRGERCAIVDEDPTRALQIFVPENRLERVLGDGTRRDKAKRSVTLQAFAHHLTADRALVKVYIQILDDFPSGWDVRFADPPAQEPDRVEIEWRQPEAEQPDDASGEETSE